MKVTITDLDQEQCRKSLLLQIPGEQVGAQIEKAAAQYAKQVTLPGFRRGYAPKSLIKQRFGKELRDEAISQILPESFNAALREHNLMLVLPPVMKETKNLDDQAVEISLEITAIPRFDGSEFKEEPVTVKKLRVTDEHVERVINSLRESKAELVPIEDRGAQTGDIVTVNLTGQIQPREQAESAVPAAEGEAAADAPQAELPEVREEAAAPAEEPDAQEAAPAPAEEPQAGAEAAAGPAGEDNVNQDDEVQQDDLDFEIGGEGILKEFTEALTDARAGDTRAFTVEYPADYNVPRIAGRRVDYQAEVTAVKMKELPALDDEFAQSVNEEYQTLDDLKDRIRKNLQAERDFAARMEAESLVMNRMVERYTFPVPREVVKSQYERHLQDLIQQIVYTQTDPTKLDIDWEAFRASAVRQAERDVRWALITESVGQAEKIEAAKNEVRQEIERLAHSRGEDPAALRARLTKEGRLDSIEEQVRTRKILDFIITSAGVTYEEVDTLAAPDDEVAAEEAQEEAEMVADLAEAGGDPDEGEAAGGGAARPEAQGDAAAGEKGA